MRRSWPPRCASHRHRSPQAPKAAGPEDRCWFSWPNCAAATHQNPGVRYRGRHDEPPWFATLNLTRPHRAIAQESRFQGLGINLFRPHQRPWLPQPLTFKLKMRKPSEHLDGYRYWNRSMGGLSPSRCARDGFWDHENSCTRKTSTAACFVRLPGALVAYTAQAPFKVLHQRFRFPQVRCVKAFCELLIDRLHQL